MSSLMVSAKASEMKENTSIEKDRRSSDMAQLESLYRRYVARVYTLCLRLLATVQTAEEATAQVFIRLSRELANWWDETHTLARLRELAIDESLSRVWRGKSQKRAPTVTTSQTPAHPGSVSPPPLNQAALDALSAKLPNDLRVAFVLRDREGLSNGAIAAHLKISEEEVRRLISVARLDLRRLWLGQ